MARKLEITQSRRETKMALTKRIQIAEKEILWKDRKRILGLPITFTRYQLDEERLIMRKGLINTATDEMLIYRILDIKLMRTLGQKIVGVGTVTLISSDKSTPQLELVNIRDSEKVRRFLGEQIERQREARRISGREYLGGLGDGAHDAF
jgi:hypothetical protein